MFKQFNSKNYFKTYFTKEDQFSGEVSCRFMSDLLNLLSLDQGFEGNIYAVIIINSVFLILLFLLCKETRCFEDNTLSYF